MVEKPKFLTEDIAKQAIGIVTEPLFGDGSQFPVNHRVAHIVVLVPARRYLPGTDLRIVTQPSVLYEHSIRQVAEAWRWPFDEIARSKAYQLWEDRNDGGTDIMPHLLYQSEAPYWGGVKRHGIVVACSGVQPWFDRMISGMVADMVVALAYNEWQMSADRKEDVCFIR